MQDAFDPGIACARAAVAALLAVVAGCGGGGSGDAPPPPPQTSALFVVNARTGDIAGFPTLPPPTGSTTSGHTLAALTSVDGPVAYDAVHDLLYVATTPPETQTDDSAQIRVFEHASNLAAGAMPARSIALEDSLYVQGMAVDGASDTLWVFYRYLVFTTIDDAIIRRVTSASVATSSVDFVLTLGHWTEAAAYDPVRDVVYATDGSGIVVLSQASTSQYWPVAPKQEFGSGIDGVALTSDSSRDIVYIADGAGSGVWVMLGASTATPTLVGPVPMPTAPTAISVDMANDRLYVSAGGSVYALDHASALTAQTLLALPTISGSASDRYWFSGATIR